MSSTAGVKLEPASLPDNKSSTTVSRIGTVTGFAALAAGAFYFVGWQYKQSLALAFGLAGYPGDFSFQGTVASGVTVFDSRLLPIVPLTLALIYFVRAAVQKIPSVLYSWTDHMRGKRLETLKAARAMRKRLHDGENVSWTEIRKAQFKSGYASWTNRVILPIAHAARHRRLVAAAINGGLIVGTTITLFYAGHYIAQRDARGIRNEAKSSCAGCFLYDAEPVAALGIPVFQSSDTIYVQEYDGLTRVAISSLKGIKAYQRNENKPFNLPRR